MGEVLQQLASEIQRHIKFITKKSGLPDTEESYEKLAQGWLEKERAFVDEVAKENLIEVESLSIDDEKGAVVLTYSGSLVLIGPKINDIRKTGYNSIGIRKDVPEMVTMEGSILEHDIRIKEPVVFEKGPVKSTSAVYKIAVCPDNITLIVQEEKLSNVTIVVGTQFIEINQKMLPAKIE